MITREGFPIVAKTAIVDITWQSLDENSVDFINARISFDNVNQTKAGSVLKERTALQTNPETPIPWPAGIPAEVIAVWGSPESALRDVLGILYESDEHQYKLKTKTPPEPEPEPEPEA